MLLRSKGRAFRVLSVLVALQPLLAEPESFGSLFCADPSLAAVVWSVLEPSLMRF